MALSEDELKTMTLLARRHDAEIGELEELDRFYEGSQPLSYMHPDILREVADRVRPVIVNWPQMVVDSVEERLRLEGFKTGDKDRDKELWRVWRASKMQLGFRQNIVDALVMRRSYICVGTNPDDKLTPYITPESPLEVYADEDPRTRRVRAALRRVNDIGPDGNTIARYATLYLPNETIWCTGTAEGLFAEEKRDKHNLGRVPVVPVVNRGRLRATTKSIRNLTVERIGRSDLTPVIPLSDAACKMATDMMVAGEFIAVPLRAIFGVGPDAFKDQDGNPVTALTAMLGRALAVDEEGAKGFEFAAAQLLNFTTGLSALAQLVASISGLPPHYLGASSDNPASAEAIAGSEARLNTRAERKIDSFDISAVEVADIVYRFQTGEWEPEVAGGRGDWRNVRTPTVAAMADAAVKLYTTSPKPIVPLRQTRERLGFDDTDIDEMEVEDEAQAAQDPIRALVNANAEQPVGQQQPAYANAPA